MNLSLLNHAINWWNKNGNINVNLMEEVLKEKTKPQANTKKRYLSIQKTVRYEG